MRITRSIGWTKILPSPTSPVRAEERRSEEHTSELQSQSNLVCRLLLEKKTETVLKLLKLIPANMTDQLPTEIHPAASIILLLKLENATNSPSHSGRRETIRPMSDAPRS